MWSEEKIPDSEGTTLERKKLRRLQLRSRNLDATIWIGKDGASEELLKQVINQLRARELVKLKVHKSALATIETTQLAEKIAQSTDATLIEVMGHTLTLYKRREQVQQKESLSKNSGRPLRLN